MISHNIETVRRLTPLIRTKAKYDTSLKVIRYLFRKWHVMLNQDSCLGLGENEQEIFDTIEDLFAAQAAES